MFFFTAVLGVFTATSVLASLTSDRSLLPRSINIGSFSLFAATIDDPAIRNSYINANDNGFWIGRVTSTSCISDPNIDCGAYSNNTILESGDRGALEKTGALGMSAAVPGGQKVYVDSNGYIFYTEPHCDVPTGAYQLLFNYTSDHGRHTFGSLETLSPATGFIACPLEDGSHRIQIVLDNKEPPSDCLAMTIGTWPWEGTAAWEYV